MMKANEFRLGNLVKCPEGFGQVTQIQDREVLVVDEIGYTMEVIKPIPLTEKWLIKFGFKHHDGWDDMKFHFRDEDAHNDNRFELLETNQGYETPSGQICKYVHQLQNCFYFHNLTGTELELKK